MLAIEAQRGTVRITSQVATREKRVLIVAILLKP